MVRMSCSQVARWRLWSRMNRRTSSSGSSGTLRRSGSTYSGGRCRRADGAGGGCGAPRRRVRRVEQGLDPLETDRGILAVIADAVGARLELAEHLLGARRGGEREIVLEEVVMAVDVRDGQDL